MVLAKDAMYTVLNTATGDWSGYSNSTVTRVEVRDDVSGRTSTAQHDWVLIFGTDLQTSHPTLDISVLEGSEIVKVDIRSNHQTRSKALLIQVLSMLNAKLTTLDSPWNYMVFVNRGRDLCRGKLYRYVIEMRLYIVDETL